MRIFNVKDHFDPDFGEYIVGSQQLGRHGVYLTLGEVSRGEMRRLAPAGHEEILLLLSGEAVLAGPDGEVTMFPDQAVYVGPRDDFAFHAKTDCRYVSAGGHPSEHGHSHGHHHDG